MAQFKIYRSVNTGSPALNGTSGSLINVFNYCLVTGSGWLKPIADGTNYGIYQQPSGSGFYLFVNDTAPSTGSAREARVTAWETITDTAAGIVTGSNPFPSGSQIVFGGVQSNCVIIRKTSDLTANNRNWIMFADDRTFYFFSLSEGYASNLTWYWGFFFGDIYSFYTGSDNYKCMISGRGIENNANQSQDYSDATCAINTTLATNYMARNYLGTGTSIKIGKHGDQNRTATLGVLKGDNFYPNPPDNSLYMSPLYISEASGSIRGTMRGLYYPLHPVGSFVDEQQITGSGDLAGKYFWIVSKNAQANGVWAVEISNTLQTN